MVIGWDGIGWDLGLVGFGELGLDWMGLGGAGWEDGVGGDGMGLLFTSSYSLQAIGLGGNVTSNGNFSRS